MFEYDIAEYSQINPDLYRRELRRLQAEFLKLQKWIIEEKKKIAIAVSYTHLTLPTKRIV